MLTASHTLPPTLQTGHHKLYLNPLLIQSRHFDTKRHLSYLTVNKRKCSRRSGPPPRPLATTVIHCDHKLEIRYTDHWQMHENEVTRRRIGLKRPFKRELIHFDIV